MVILIGLKARWFKKEIIEDLKWKHLYKSNGKMKKNNVKAATISPIWYTIYTWWGDIFGSESPQSEGGVLMNLLILCKVAFMTLISPDPY